MNIQISPGETRKNVFKLVGDYLKEHGLRIADSDDTRPWGGFYVINELDSAKFIIHFFKGLSGDHDKHQGRVSPKILIVEAGKRLSWQYHHRRSEIWKLVNGEASVVVSDTDKEGETNVLLPGDIIRLKQGERHRLIGTNSWGVLAEIWQHTDPQFPSDEDDIVRVQDDFGR